MAVATPVLPKLVGERVKRREDPRLIQGRGTPGDQGRSEQRVHEQRRRYAGGRRQIQPAERRHEDEQIEPWLGERDEVRGARARAGHRVAIDRGIGGAHA